VAAGDGLGRNPVVAVADNLLGGVRGGLDFAKRTLTGAGEAVTHPTTVPERAAGALDASRSLFRQAAVTEPARSPLWAERSLRRHLEVLSIPLPRRWGARSTTCS
jgi:diacylglycerol O-acyltransferase